MTTITWRRSARRSGVALATALVTCALASGTAGGAALAASAPDAKAAPAARVTLKHCRGGLPHPSFVACGSRSPSWLLATGSQIRQVGYVHNRGVLRRHLQELLGLPLGVHNSWALARRT